ncbi:MAG: hypothetical protein AABY22_00625 [Nanoarchaeota archaeon]
MKGEIGRCPDNPFADPAPHKTVKVQYKDMEADIDEEIAPLILELWKRDLITINSCQGHFEEPTWIQFMSFIDAIDFINLIAKYPSKKELKITKFWDTLYGHIFGYGEGDNWEYSIYPMNWNIEETLINNDEIIEKCVGKTDINFQVSIRFPQKDLPEIMQRLVSAAGK